MVWPGTLPDHPNVTIDIAIAVIQIFLFFTCFLLGLGHSHISRCRSFASLDAFTQTRLKSLQIGYREYKQPQSLKR
jgi:hypothetical protein